MAQRTGQGASTLSQAAAGERLPTLPVLLAYVRACGGDETLWQARWREAAAEAATQPRTGDADAAPPYRGLARFEPGDADLFFGRDDLTDRLLTLTRSRRFSAVFGPSGSGKSSLLRAGLIPRLRAPDRGDPRPLAVRVLTPGEHPLRTHEQRLVPKAGDGDTWLIIDQFEELYTLCTDRGERDRFIDRLLAAADPASRLRVVIAVRADFLGHCAEHPALTAVLQDGTVLAGPMSRDQLREAITKPAQAAGLIVERALTARILDDVEGEPGALPLMSHALLETWNRRNGRALSLAAYEAAGGLQGAVTHTAEAVHGRLTPDQAQVAQRLLLRLISPGDGTQDTRRPLAREDLPLEADPDLRTVLERLARARLITLGHDTVDLAHEALITSWPRLRGWIDTHRERLRIHRRLTEAARTWEALDHDPGALYRGTRLSDAEEAFTRREDLSARESAFLTASLKARRDEQRAAARTTRRLQTLLAGLTALTLVTCAAALVSVRQRDAARAERAVAVSRRMDTEADQLRGTTLPGRVQNISLAAQLDIASYRMHPSARTYTHVINDANTPLFTEIPGDGSQADGVGRDTVQVAADAHRRLLATATADGTVRLWNTRDFLHPRRVGRSLKSYDVALSSDGRRLAVDTVSSISLWDTSDPFHPTRLTTIRMPGESSPSTMALSPDGHLLAAGGDRVHLWDVHDGRHPERLARTLPGDAPAFSPRGHVLATGSFEQNEAVRLWDVTRPARIKELSALTDQGGPVFSPDGQTLGIAATALVDGQVPLWNVGRPKRPRRLPRPLRTADGSGPTAVAFSPDGRVAAVAGDSGAQLWSMADGQRPQRLGEPLAQRSSHGTALLFGPGHRQLITHDGTMRVWSLPATVQLGCPKPAVAGFSPDGHTMATICRSLRRVQLWKVADPGAGGSLSSLPGRAAVFAPGGHLLAVAGPRGGAWLWDVTDPAHPRRRGRIATRGDHMITSLAFSRDGRILAEKDEGTPSLGAADDPQFLLWDVNDPLRPRRRGTAVKVDFADMELSPDGRTLATGSGGSIWLWDIRDPRHVVLATDALDGDAVAMAPHGHLLAVAGDGFVRLWDAAHPAHPGPLGPPVDADRSASAIAFSPDGRTMATATTVGTVRLWDISDPARPSGLGDALIGHTSTVGTTVFSPRNRILATASDDGTTRLWDLDAGRAIRRICAATGQTLTQQDWSRLVGSSPYRPPCP
ncbi:nSTAND1 domain-containing NTPase [Streptomyces filipinensis]|nr:hypothetical protein [Streptomyces filipinensis]